MPNIPLTEAYKILLLVWNKVSNSELMVANKLSYILVIEKKTSLILYGP